MGGSLLTVNDAQERMTKEDFMNIIKHKYSRADGISAACGNFGAMPFAS